MAAIALTMRNRVKALREERGWTQSDLGDRIAASWQTISRIENGHTRIMPKRESALAEVFGLVPGDLYEQPGVNHGQAIVSDASDRTPFAMAIRQARRQRGATIRNVAEAISVGVDEVAAWEAGEDKPSAEQLPALADFLRVRLDDLNAGLVTPTDDDPLGDAVFVSGAQPRFVGPRDVEKYGVVAAGDDGDFQFNGTVAEYVSRPKGLVGRAGVFSLEVISESMYPAYRKHDVVFCDRTEPQIGDDVVIETFPEDGSQVGKAYIKRLKRRTKSALIVEQFNPPSELKFDPYSIKHLWRVVPNRELHGF